MGDLSVNKIQLVSGILSWISAEHFLKSFQSTLAVGNSWLESPRTILEAHPGAQELARKHRSHLVRFAAFFLRYLRFLL